MLRQLSIITRLSQSPKRLSWNRVYLILQFRSSGHATYRRRMLGAGAAMHKRKIPYSRWFVQQPEISILGCGEHQIRQISGSQVLGRYVLAAAVYYYANSRRYSHFSVYPVRVVDVGRTTDPEKYIAPRTLQSIYIIPYARRYPHATYLGAQRG